MEDRVEVGIGILLTIMALIIGIFGIAVLIGVGEGANNAIVAFAAISFPFALLAGIFSWIVPRAQWPIAIAICAPVALLSCAGSGSGGAMLLGSLWTVVLSCGGAALGAWLRQSRSGSDQSPPS